MNILITGGTGLLGKRLISKLLSEGMFPRLASRGAMKQTDVPQFRWNIGERTLDESMLDDVDVVIHLAGANIADGRWTPKRKKEILDSRIQSTRLLYDAIEKMKKRPKTLICASATGFYGIQEFEHESEENETAGSDFLAQVCEQWEVEADRFTSLDIRVVKVRTGVVLDADGGALPKMIMPIRYYSGAALGLGTQYINWIHWKDWCRTVLHLINNEDLIGAFNLVAPNPVTNAQLTRLIASRIKRPLWLPNIPSFILKLLLGEMSSVVLTGHKASSMKIEKTGFKFEHETAKQTISELLGQD